MNKKDIALTVGGVLATMVLAYLLYRLQQRDAANAAAASATDAANAAAALANEEQEQQAESDAASSLSSVTASGQGTSTAVTTSSPVDTNDVLPTDDNDLISNTLAAFAAQQQGTSGSSSSNTIPTSLMITPVADTSVLPSVPTTANQAFQNTYEDFGIGGGSSGNNQYSGTPGVTAISDGPTSTLSGLPGATPVSDGPTNTVTGTPNMTSVTDGPTSVNPVQNPGGPVAYPILSSGDTDTSASTSTSTPTPAPTPIFNHIVSGLFS